VLFNAVRRKDVKAVAALLAKGADPSVCGPDGRTVMNLAVELGNVGIIEMLREASGTVQRDINKQHKS
jgi:ankyrin repeat protein